MDEVPAGRARAGNGCVKAAAPATPFNTKPRRSIVPRFRRVIFAPALVAVPRTPGAHLYDGYPPPPTGLPNDGTPPRHVDRCAKAAAASPGQTRWALT